MAKIIIADISYTTTDETFYVLNKSHDNAKKYAADTLENTFVNLQANGWNKCGKVNRSDGSPVDMLTNYNSYIAVWEEHSLSHLDQVKLYIDNEIERNGIGHEVSRQTIIGGLPLVFERNNEHVRPSDYCYNLWNEGEVHHNFDWPAFFERTKAGYYRILGSDYPYTGKILDAKTQGKEEKIVGYWHKGQRYRIDLQISSNKLDDSSVESLLDYLETDNFNHRQIEDSLVTNNLLPLELTPKPPPKLVVGEVANYQRDPSISATAIKLANFNCQFNNSHITFVSKVTGENYVEAHHLIPMAYQGLFEHSIDVVPNIVCLCPLCHKRIHHAIDIQRKEMILFFYDKLRHNLQKVGITVNRNDLLTYYRLS